MKKIRNLVLIVLCILTVALFAGCSSTPAAAEKTKFIVGLDDSFPPMGFRDDSNNIVGFDVDLATEVANRLGMEVELKPIDWDAKVLELNSGSVDVLWNGVSITEERKQEMDFSRPYLANQQVIIVKADSDIADIASLAGKIVGLQKGSSALDALNKKLAEKGGTLIGVNTFTLGGDEAAISEAKDVLMKKGATYQNVYFASDSEAGKFTSNILAYPTTYVVDRNGNIVGEPIVGAITEKKQAETLQKLIDQALAADMS